MGLLIAGVSYKKDSCIPCVDSNNGVMVWVSLSLLVSGIQSQIRAD